MPRKGKLVRSRQLEAARAAKRQDLPPAPMSTDSPRHDRSVISTPAPMSATDSPVPSTSSTDCATQEPFPSTSQAGISESTSVSASRKKLDIAASRSADTACGDAQSQKWLISHVDQLTKLLAQVPCPECFENELEVGICEGGNQGFSTKLELLCHKCGFRADELSSPRVGGSTKKNVAFEVNRLMTLFSHEVGTGHRVLEKFSTIFGLPGMHKKTFQRHDRLLTEVEVQEGAEVLERAAAAVREAYSATDEDLQESLVGGEIPIIDISVSYDGTWHKRVIVLISIYFAFCPTRF